MIDSLGATDECAQVPALPGRVGAHLHKQVTLPKRPCALVEHVQGASVWSLRCRQRALKGSEDPQGKSQVVFPSLPDDGPCPHLHTLGPRRVRREQQRQGLSSALLTQAD